MTWREFFELTPEQQQQAWRDFPPPPGYTEVQLAYRVDEATGRVVEARRKTNQQPFKER